MTKTHLEFEVSDTGFFIDCCTPYLGATPDAISNCACCGKGVIEIKCPYCQRSGLPDTDEDTRFCLESENDIRKLRTDHTYYFQVQLQMHVCAVDHADFVVWTEKDIFVERINKDASFVPDKLDTVKYTFSFMEYCQSSLESGIHVYPSAMILESFQYLLAKVHLQKAKLLLLLMMMMT